MKWFVQISFGKCQIVYEINRRMLEKLYLRRRKKSPSSDHLSHELAHFIHSKCAGVIPCNGLNIAHITYNMTLKVYVT